MSRKCFGTGKCIGCVHVLDVEEDAQGKDVITCALDECEPKMISPYWELKE